MVAVSERTSCRTWLGQHCAFVFIGKVEQRCKLVMANHSANIGISLQKEECFAGKVVKNMEKVWLDG